MVAVSGGCSSITRSIDRHHSSHLYPLTHSIHTLGDTEVLKQQSDLRILYESAEKIINSNQKGTMHNMSNSKTQTYIDRSQTTSLRPS